MKTKEPLVDYDAVLRMRFNSQFSIQFEERQGEWMLENDDYLMFNLVASALFDY